jgi:hypothetical protein
MRKHLVFWGVCAFVFVVEPIFTSAYAEQIQIHLTGLNFKYDGMDVFDGAAKAGGNYNTAEADPLTTIDFFKNNVYMGTLTANDNIFADILIDDVQNIPLGGGILNTGDGIPGFGLDLLQHAGSQTTALLSLEIDQLRISYSGYGMFVAVGGLADGLVAQNLPFGLSIGAQDDISLVLSSSNLTNLAYSGNYLSAFDAFGTGDINSFPIPEPTAIAALIGLAVFGLGSFAFCRHEKSH